MLSIPLRLVWKNPAIGRVLQKEIGKLLGTAEERTLCHRQLVDAGRAL
jgi:hypothetical protein